MKDTHHAKFVIRENRLPFQEIFSYNSILAIDF